MIEIILAVMAGTLALTALALQRLYSVVPVYELKRLSRHGDDLARSLYRVAAYGISLRLLLWGIATVGFAVSFVLLDGIVPGWAAAILMTAVLALAFVPVTSLGMNARSAVFASWFSPALVAILSRTQRLLVPVARVLNSRRTHTAHSRLYEKEDLVSLLHQQKEQPDNRIAHDDLELAHRALAFDERQAADIVVPRGQTLLVDADDSLGPILLDQLHKSGQTTFLVYKDARENVIGSLAMRDAVAAKSGGRVMDLVRRDLCYVHEDFSLREVLAAFQRSGQSLATVINSFEEFVGTITLADLLSELLGERPGAGRITYDDRAAVAARVSKPTVATASGDLDILEPVPVQEEAASPEAPEVVE